MSREDLVFNMYFKENRTKSWDGTIRLDTIKDRPDWRRLVKKVPCGEGYIPGGYEYNGANVIGLIRAVFPKWRNPIATVRHDWRRQHARNFDDDAFADAAFHKDVRKTSGRVISYLGYLGVRANAYKREYKRWREN